MTGIRGSKRGKETRGDKAVGIQYGPLVSSPEAIYADEDFRTGRGDQDGANIGTKHYEIRSPGVCRSPACIGRRW